jgi:hypothetical protein
MNAGLFSMYLLLFGFVLKLQHFLWAIPKAFNVLRIFLVTDLPVVCASLIKLAF